MELDYDRCVATKNQNTWDSSLHKKEYVSDVEVTYCLIGVLQNEVTLQRFAAVSKFLEEIMSLEFDKIMNISHHRLVI